MNGVVGSYLSLLIISMRLRRLFVRRPHGNREADTTRPGPTFGNRRINRDDGPENTVRPTVPARHLLISGVG